MARRWSEEEEALVRELRGTMSILAASARIGRSEEALKSYLKRKGIGWGRWARVSPRRERLELIRQRHVVSKAVAFLERVKEYGTVVSKVELVRMSGAKAVIQHGRVVACPDEVLLDEAADKARYRKAKGGPHVVYKPKS